MPPPPWRISSTPRAGKMPLQVSSHKPLSSTQALDSVPPDQTHPMIQQTPIAVRTFPKSLALLWLPTSLTENLPTPLHAIINAARTVAHDVHPAVYLRYFHGHHLVAVSAPAEALFAALAVISDSVAQNDDEGTSCSDSDINDENVPFQQSTSNSQKLSEHISEAIRKPKPCSSAKYESNAKSHRSPLAETNQKRKEAPQNSFVVADPLGENNSPDRVDETSISQRTKSQDDSTRPKVEGAKHSPSRSGDTRKSKDEQEKILELQKTIADLQKRLSAQEQQSQKLCSQSQPHSISDPQFYSQQRQQEKQSTHTSVPLHQDFSSGPNRQYQFGPPGMLHNAFGSANVNYGSLHRDQNGIMASCPEAYSNGQVICNVMPTHTAYDIPQQYFHPQFSIPNMYIPQNYHGFQSNHHHFLHHHGMAENGTHTSDQHGRGSYHTTLTPVTNGRALEEEMKKRNIQEHVIPRSSQPSISHHIEKEVNSEGNEKKHAGEGKEETGATVGTTVSDGVGAPIGGRAASEEKNEGASVGNTNLERGALLKSSHCTEQEGSNQSNTQEVVTQEVVSNEAILPKTTTTVTEKDNEGGNSKETDGTSLIEEKRRNVDTVTKPAAGSIEEHKSKNSGQSAHAQPTEQPSQSRPPNLENHSTHNDLKIGEQDNVATEPCDTRFKLFPDVSKSNPNESRKGQNNHIRRKEKLCHDNLGDHSHPPKPFEEPQGSAQNQDNPPSPCQMDTTSEKTSQTSSKFERKSPQLSTCPNSSSPPSHSYRDHKEMRDSISNAIDHTRSSEYKSPNTLSPVKKDKIEFPTWQQRNLLETKENGEVQDQRMIQDISRRLPTEQSVPKDSTKNSSFSGDAIESSILLYNNSCKSASKTYTSEQIRGMSKITDGEPSVPPGFEPQSHKSAQSATKFGRMENSHTRDYGDECTPSRTHETSISIPGLVSTESITTKASIPSNAKKSMQERSQSKQIDSTMSPFPKEDTSQKEEIAKKSDKHGTDCKDNGKCASVVAPLSEIPPFLANKKKRRKKILFTNEPSLTSRGKKEERRPTSLSSKIVDTKSGKQNGLETMSGEHGAKSGRESVYSSSLGNSKRELHVHNKKTGASSEVEKNTTNGNTEAISGISDHKMLDNCLNGSGTAPAKGKEHQITSKTVHFPRKSAPLLENNGSAKGRLRNIVESNVRTAEKHTFESTNSEKDLRPDDQGKFVKAPQPKTRDNVVTNWKMLGSNKDENGGNARSKDDACTQEEYKTKEDGWIQVSRRRGGKREHAGDSEKERDLESQTHEKTDEKKKVTGIGEEGKEKKVPRKTSQTVSSNVRSEKKIGDNNGVSSSMGEKSGYKEIPPSPPLDSKDAKSIKGQNVSAKETTDKKVVDASQTEYFRFSSVVYGIVTKEDNYVLKIMSVLSNVSLIAEKSSRNANCVRGCGTRENIVLCRKVSREVMYFLEGQPLRGAKVKFRVFSMSQDCARKSTGRQGYKIIREMQEKYAVALQVVSEFTSAEGRAPVFFAGELDGIEKASEALKQTTDIEEITPRKEDVLPLARRDE